MQLVYWSHKIKHNGVCSYKTFEGFTRSYSEISRANLLRGNYYGDDSQVVGQEIELPRQVSCCKIKQYIITPAISKKIKEACNKMHYYSGTRRFTSKKSGTYTMRTAFITLGAPDNYTIAEINKALDSFLDYLRRTANCQYVYKKEIGYKSGKFHVHLMVNNFIPYYLVNWKWKRCLLAQNPDWPLNEQGKPTEAHYRIELPRNGKQAGAYIAKYMSKTCELFQNVGKLWGQSKELKEIQEHVYIEEDLPQELLLELSKKFKTLVTDYSSFICLNPLRLPKEFQWIVDLFEPFYVEVSQRITGQQRYTFV